MTPTDVTFLSIDLSSGLARVVNYVCQSARHPTCRKGGRSKWPSEECEKVGRSWKILTLSCVNSDVDADVENRRSDVAEDPDKFVSLSDVH